MAMNMFFKKDINAYHKIGRIDITEGLDIAGKKQEIQQLELLHASFFRDALRHHHEIDKTHHFAEFYENVKPYALSLPLIMHFREKILIVLLTHMTRQKSQCLGSLLDLIPPLVQDLHTDFIPHFGETIQVMISIMQYQDNAQIEKCFQSMQRIFKILESALTPYFLELYYSSFAALLSHNREAVREFAAETLGFLLKRIRKKQDLQTILSYILLPPHVFVTLMERSTIGNKIEHINEITEDQLSTIQFTQNDQDKIIEFQQQQEDAKIKAQQQQYNDDDNNNNDLSSQNGNKNKRFDLVSAIKANPTLLTAQEMARLHDVRNVRKAHQNKRDELFVTHGGKSSSNKDADGNISLLNQNVITKIGTEKTTTTIASKMRTTKSMKDVTWTDTMVHRLTDGLSRLIFFAIKNVSNQLTFDHQRIIDAVLTVSSSSYINQTNADIITLLSTNGKNNNGNDEDNNDLHILFNNNNSTQQNRFNLHSFRLEIVQTVYCQLADHTIYDQHTPVLDTLYKPLTGLILNLSNIISDNNNTTGNVNTTTSLINSNTTKTTVLSSASSLDTKKGKQQQNVLSSLAQKKKKQNMMADSSTVTESSESSSDSDDDDNTVNKNKQSFSKMKKLGVGSNTNKVVNKKMLLAQKQQQSKQTSTQVVNKKNGSDDDDDNDADEEDGNVATTTSKNNKMNDGDDDEDADDNNVDHKKFALSFNYTTRNSTYLRLPNVADYYYDFTILLSAFQMLLTDSFGSKIAAYNNCAELFLNVFSILLHTPTLNNKLEQQREKETKRLNFMQIDLYEIMGLIYSILATNFIILYKTVYRIYQTDQHLALFTPTQHSTSFITIQNLENNLPKLLLLQQQEQKKQQQKEQKDNNFNMVPIFYTILTSGLRLIVPNLTFTTHYLPHIVQYALDMTSSSINNNNNNDINNNITQMLDLAISPQPTYITNHQIINTTLYTPLNLSSLFYQYLTVQSDPLATLSSHWTLLWKNPKYTVQAMYKRSFYQQYITHRIAEYHHYNYHFKNNDNQMTLIEQQQEEKNNNLTNKQQKLLQKLNENKLKENQNIILEQQKIQTDVALKTANNKTTNHAIFTPYIYPLIFHSNVISNQTNNLLNNLVNTLTLITIDVIKKLNMLYEEIGLTTNDNNSNNKALSLNIFNIRYQQLLLSLFNIINIHMGLFTTISHLDVTININNEQPEKKFKFIDVIYTIYNIIQNDIMLITLQPQVVVNPLLTSNIAYNSIKTLIKKDNNNNTSDVKILQIKKYKPIFYQQSITILLQVLTSIEMILYAISLLNQPILQTTPLQIIIDIQDRNLLSNITSPTTTTTTTTNVIQSQKQQQQTTKKSINNKKQTKQKEEEDKQKEEKQLNNNWIYLNDKLPIYPISYINNHKSILQQFGIYDKTTSTKLISSLQNDNNNNNNDKLLSNILIKIFLNIIFLLTFTQSRNDLDNNILYTTNKSPLCQFIPSNILLYIHTTMMQRLSYLTTLSSSIQNLTSIPLHVQKILFSRKEWDKTLTDETIHNNNTQDVIPIDQLNIPLNSLLSFITFCFNFSSSTSTISLDNNNNKKTKNFESSYKEQYEEFIQLITILKPPRIVVQTEEDAAAEDETPQTDSSEAEDNFFKTRGSKVMRKQENYDKRQQKLIDKGIIKSQDERETLRTMFHGEKQRTNELRIINREKEYNKKENIFTITIPSGLTTSQERDYIHTRREYCLKNYQQRVEEQFVIIKNYLLQQHNVFVNRLYTNNKQNQQNNTNNIILSLTNLLTPIYDNNTNNYIVQNIFTKPQEILFNIITPMSRSISLSCRYHAVTASLTLPQLAFKNKDEEQDKQNNIIRNKVLNNNNSIDDMSNDHNVRAIELMGDIINDSDNDNDDDDNTKIIKNKKQSNNNKTSLFSVTVKHENSNLLYLLYQYITIPIRIDTAQNIISQIIAILSMIQSDNIPTQYITLLTGLLIASFSIHFTGHHQHIQKSLNLLLSISPDIVWPMLYETLYDGLIHNNIALQVNICPSYYGARYPYPLTISESIIKSITKYTNVVNIQDDDDENKNNDDINNLLLCYINNDNDNDDDNDNDKFDFDLEYNNTTSAFTSKNTTTVDLLNKQELLRNSKKSSITLLNQKNTAYLSTISSYIPSLDVMGHHSLTNNVLIALSTSNGNTSGGSNNNNNNTITLISDIQQQQKIQKIIMKHLDDILNIFILFFTTQWDIIYPTIQSAITTIQPIYIQDNNIQQSQQQQRQFLTVDHTILSSTSLFFEKTEWAGLSRVINQVFSTTTSQKLFHITLNNNVNIKKLFFNNNNQDNMNENNQNNNNNNYYTSTLLRNNYIQLLAETMENYLTIFLNGINHRIFFNLNITQTILLPLFTRLIGISLPKVQQLSFKLLCVADLGYFKPYITILERLLDSKQYSNAVTTLVASLSYSIQREKDGFNITIEQINEQTQKINARSIKDNNNKKKDNKNNNTSMMIDSNNNDDTANNDLLINSNLPPPPPPGVLLIAKQHRPYLLPILFRLLNSQVKVGKKVHISSIRNQISIILSILPIYETIPYLTQHFTQLIIFMMNILSPEYKIIIQTLLYNQFKQFNNMLNPLLSSSSSQQQEKEQENNKKTLSNNINIIINNSLTLNIKNLYQKYINLQLQYETILSLIPHILIKTSEHDGLPEILRNYNITNDNNNSTSIDNITMGNVLANTYLWSIDFNTQCNVLNITGNGNNVNNNKSPLLLPQKMSTFVLQTAASIEGIRNVICNNNNTTTMNTNITSLFPYLTFNNKTNNFIENQNNNNIPIKELDNVYYSYNKIIKPMNFEMLLLNNNNNSSLLLTLLPELPVERLLNILHAILTFVEKVRNGCSPLLNILLNLTMLMLTIATKKLTTLQNVKQKKLLMQHYGPNYNKNNINDIIDEDDDDIEDEDDSDIDEDDEIIQDEDDDEEEDKIEIIDDEEDNDEEEEQHVARLELRIRQYKELRTVTLQFISLLVELFHEKMGCDVEIVDKQEYIKYTQQQQKNKKNDNNDTTTSTTEIIQVFGKSIYQIVPKLKTIYNNNNESSNDDNNKTIMYLKIMPRQHYKYIINILTMLGPYLTNMYAEQYTRRTALLNIIVSLLKHRSTQPILSLPQFKDVLPSFLGMLSSPQCDKSVSTAVIEGIEHLINTRQQLSIENNKKLKEQTKKLLKQQTLLKKQKQQEEKDMMDNDDSDDDDDDSDTSDDDDDDNDSNSRSHNNNNNDDMSDDERYISKMNQQLNRALQHQRQLTNSATSLGVSEHGMTEIALGISTAHTPTNETSDNSPGLHTIIEKMLKYLSPILCSHLNDRLCNILGVNIETFMGLTSSSTSTSSPTNISNAKQNKKLNKKKLLGDDNDDDEEEEIESPLLKLIQEDDGEEEEKQKINPNKKNTPTFEPTLFLNTGNQSKHLPQRELNLVFQISTLIDESSTSSILCQLILPHLPRGLPRPPHSLDMQGGITDMAATAAAMENGNNDGKQDRAVQYNIEQDTKKTGHKKGKITTNEISSSIGNGVVLTQRQLQRVLKQTQILNVILTIFNNILNNITNITFLLKLQDFFIAKLLTVFDLKLRVKLIDILVNIKQRIVLLNNQNQQQEEQKQKNNNNNKEEDNDIINKQTMSTNMLRLLTSLTSITVQKTQLEPDFQQRGKAYQALTTNTIDEFIQILTEPLQHRPLSVTSKWKCQVLISGHNNNNNVKEEKQYFTKLDLQALCWVILHDLYSPHMVIRDYATDAAIKLISSMNYEKDNLLYPTIQSQIVETFHRHSRLALSRRELVITRRSFLNIISTCGKTFPDIYPSYNVLSTLILNNNNENNNNVGNFFEMITDVQSNQRMVAFKALRNLLDIEWRQQQYNINIKQQNNNNNSWSSLSQPIYKSIHTTTIVQFILPLLYNFLQESQIYFDLYQQINHSSGDDDNDEDDQNNKQQQYDNKKRKFPGQTNSTSGVLPFKNIYGIDNQTIDEIIRCIATVSRLLSWNQYKSYLVILLNSLSQKSGKRLHKVNLRLVCNIIDLFPFPLGRSASEMMTIEKNMEIFNNANQNNINIENLLKQQHERDIDGNGTASGDKSTILDLTDTSSSNKIIIRSSDDKILLEQQKEAKRNNKKGSNKKKEQQQDKEALTLNDIIYENYQGISPYSQQKQEQEEKLKKLTEQEIKDIQIINTIALIRRDISNKLVPSILKFCTELTNLKKGAANNKTKATKIRTVRTAVIMTVIKLLQKLTANDFSLHFPKLIRIIIEQLGRKDPEERYIARIVLLDVIRMVGSDFLFYILMELQQVLITNYQKHVLTYDIVSLLNECYKLTLLYPTYNNKIKIKYYNYYNKLKENQNQNNNNLLLLDNIKINNLTLNEELNICIYNPKRIAHNIDYCIPTIMRLMHDDYFGLLAEEKAILGGGSIHPEMKITNNMLKTMNLLGRMLTFNKMMTFIITTLWQEFDIIKKTTFKNNDPLLITHKVTLCCHNLIIGLKQNPTATFNDIVRFATTLLATSTGITLNEDFFNDNIFDDDNNKKKNKKSKKGKNNKKTSMNDVDELDSLVGLDVDSEDDDDDDEYDAYAEEVTSSSSDDSDSSSSDSDKFEDITSEDDNVKDNVKNKLKRQELKKSKRYTGEIYKNNDNFNTNVITYKPELHKGKKITRDQVYEIKQNKLLHKYQIDRHEMGELMKDINITRLTLNNIDFQSYYSLSTVLLLCTDLFHLSCTSGMMKNIILLSDDTSNLDIDNNNNNTMNDNILNDNNTSTMHDEIIKNVIETKNKLQNKDHNITTLTATSRNISKYVLILLDPLPQILLRAILNIKKHEKENKDGIGIISTNNKNNTINGGNDKLKREEFQQQQSRTSTVLLSALRLGNILTKLNLSSWRRNNYHKIKVLTSFTIKLLRDIPLPKITSLAAANHGADSRDKALHKLGTKQHIESIHTMLHLTGMKLLRFIYQRYINKIKLSPTTLEILLNILLLDVTNELCGGDALYLCRILIQRGGGSKNSFFNRLFEKQQRLQKQQELIEYQKDQAQLKKLENKMSIVNNDANEKALKDFKKYLKQKEEIKKQQQQEQNPYAIVDASTNSSSTSESSTITMKNNKKNNKNTNTTTATTAVIEINNYTNTNYHHPILVDIAAKSADRMINSSKPHVKKHAMMLFYTYLTKFEISITKLTEHITWLLALLTQSTLISTRLIVCEVIYRIIAGNTNLTILSNNNNKKEVEKNTTSSDNYLTTQSQTLFLTLCVALYNENNIKVRKLISLCITTLFKRLRYICYTGNNNNFEQEKITKVKLYIEPLLKMLFTWMSIDNDSNMANINSTHLRMSYAVLPLIIESTLEWIAPFLPIVMKSIAYIIDATNKQMIQESKDRIEIIKQAYAELTKLKAKRQRKKLLIAKPNIDIDKINDDQYVLLTSKEYQQKNGNANQQQQLHIEEIDDDEEDEQDKALNQQITELELQIATGGDDTLLVKNKNIKQEEEEDEYDNDDGGEDNDEEQSDVDDDIDVDNVMEKQYKQLTTTTTNKKALTSSSSKINTNNKNMKIKQEQNQSTTKAHDNDNDDADEAIEKAAKLLFKEEDLIEDDTNVIEQQDIDDQDEDDEANGEKQHINMDDIVNTEDDANNNNKSKNNDNNQEEEDVEQLNINMSSNTACNQWYMCFSALQCFDALWKILPLPIMTFMSSYDFTTHTVINPDGNNNSKKPKTHFWSIILNLTKYKHHWVRQICLQLINTHYDIILNLCSQAIASSSPELLTILPDGLSEIFNNNTNNKKNSLLNNKDIVKYLPLRNIPNMFNFYTMFGATNSGTSIHHPAALGVQGIFQTAQAICRLYNSAFIDNTFINLLNKAIYNTILLLILYTDHNSIKDATLQAKDILTFKSNNIKKDDDDNSNDASLSSQNLISNYMPAMNGNHNNTNTNKYNNTALLWVTTNLSYLFKNTDNEMLQKYILQFFLTFVQTCPVELLIDNNNQSSTTTTQTPTLTDTAVKTEEQTANKKKLRTLDGSTTTAPSTTTVTTTTTNVQQHEPNPLLLSILSPVFRLIERISKKTKDLRIQALEIQAALSQKIGKTLTIDTLDYIRRIVNNKRSQRNINKVMSKGSFAVIKKGSYNNNAGNSGRTGSAGKANTNNNNGGQKKFVKKQRLK